VSTAPAYLRIALKHLRASGGAMPALIARHGTPSLSRTRNTLQSLARAIVYQQLSGKAAGTIYGRFLALYPGGRFPTAERLLATPFDDLRGVGLSRGKASFLLDLAAKFADGTIQPRRFARATEAEIAETLLQVKGIGQWSVDMFLIFGLNRPDVLPVGDLGVQRGMMRYFGRGAMPTPKQMVRLAEPWQPYRSIATYYMWRVSDDGLP
jgi:DNA-3-methyladenine glycosylase II